MIFQFRVLFSIPIRILFHVVNFCFYSTLVILKRSIFSSSFSSSLKIQCLKLSYCTKFGTLILRVLSCETRILQTVISDLCSQAALQSVSISPLKMHWNTAKYNIHSWFRNTLAVSASSLLSHSHISTNSKSCNLCKYPWSIYTLHWRLPYACFPV